MKICPYPVEKNGHRLSKVDYETDVGIIIVLRHVHEIGEITQNKGHYAVQVIQGHRLWYQSKAHIRLPISD